MADYESIHLNDDMTEPSNSSVWKNGYDTYYYYYSTSKEYVTKNKMTTSSHHWKELLSVQKRYMYEWIIEIKHLVSTIIITTDNEKRTVALKKIKERIASSPRWRIRIAIPIVLIVAVYDLVWMIRPLDNNNSNSNNFGTLQQPVGPIIDVISIGSLLKQPYQNAQHRTFATSSSFVRKYHRITERNDTDTECFTSLTSDQVNDVIKFCHSTQRPQSFAFSQSSSDIIGKVLFHDLFQSKKHTGYLCAQKRIMDGLYKVLQHYDQSYKSNRNLLIDIPDYLFLIEDDTYMNLDVLLPDLVQSYPSHVPYAISGCLRTIPVAMNVDTDATKTTTSSNIFTYPSSGFGTILTKASIQRLLQPIHTNDNDQFSTLVQHQLQQDAIGEYHYHKDGMSLIDLMHQYASNNLFTNVHQWKHVNHRQYTTDRDTGYCLSSDTSLAYFINYYFITVPDDQLENYTNDYDALRQAYTFVSLTGGNNDTTANDECSHERDTCTIHHRICHKLQPEQMDTLYNEYKNHTKHS